ncbi:MAG: Chromosome partitioning protein [Verrucomicrobiota bacterium]|jgi:chromosome partitioning protein
MPISFTFCNQKGGVGKTTLSYHLAHYLQQLGKKVLVVDLDGQGNISSRLTPELKPGCYRSRHLFDAKLVPAEIMQTESGIDLIYALDGDNELHGIEKEDLKVIGNFNQNLGQLSESYDYVVMDTPPAPGVKLFAGVLTADHVYVPVELSAFAVSGVSQVLRSFGVLSRQLNTPIRCAGIIVNKFNSRVDSHHKAVAEIRKESGNLVMNSQLVIRGTFDNAMTIGKPVWDVRATGAQRESGQEMVALMEEICTNSGIDVSQHPSRQHLVKKPTPSPAVKAPKPSPKAKAKTSAPKAAAKTVKKKA